MAGNEWSRKNKDRTEGRDSHGTGQVRLRNQSILFGVATPPPKGPPAASGSTRAPPPRLQSSIDHAPNP